MDTFCIYSGCFSLTLKNIWGIIFTKNRKKIVRLQILFAELYIKLCVDKTDDESKSLDAVLLYKAIKLIINDWNFCVTQQKYFYSILDKVWLLLSAKMYFLLNKLCAICSHLFHGGFMIKLPYFIKMCLKEIWLQDAVMVKQSHYRIMKCLFKDFLIILSIRWILSSYEATGFSLFELIDSKTYVRQFLSTDLKLYCHQRNKK